MFSFRWLPLASLLVTGAFAALPAPAAVVVVANRTEKAVRFRVEAGQGKPEEYLLDAGGLVTIPLAGPANLTLSAGSATRRFPLPPASAHALVDSAGSPILRPLLETANAAAPGEISKPLLAPAKLTIPVKLFVDDEEPAVRRVWEDRLRKRVQAASDLLEAQCRVRFEVVEVGTWESNDKITDFRELHAEFERLTKPDPARLAIGFTSQLPHPQGHTHLGMTRTILHPHILIREWFPRSEPERVEVLVHELAHFLGASHSAERDSVMRPKLADGKALDGRFHIRLDPLNALAVGLVAGEVSARKVRGLRELSPAVREQLGRVYLEIARALPDDPASAELMRALEQTPVRAREPDRTETSTLLTDSAKQVVAAVVRAAQRNHQLPARAAGVEGQFRLTGDELTELYVREAAAAARKLPEKHVTPAFLLGIGVAIDSSDFLRKNPATRGMVASIETEDERRQRMGVLGLPTMRGRHDLAQHFVVSCALTALLGPQLAEAAGLLKEQLDMQPGGSGFSFADLCADLSGVTFAVWLREKGTLPAELPATFTVARFLPDVAGLREGLSQEAFTRDYGATSDGRFQTEHFALLKRILVLPGYKAEPK